MFCGFAKVLQDRGLNLLQSQGIQVLLGNVASEVTKDEVRAFVRFVFFFSHTGRRCPIVFGGAYGPSASKCRHGLLCVLAWVCTR